MHTMYMYTQRYVKYLYCSETKGTTSLTICRQLLYL